MALMSASLARPWDSMKARSWGMGSRAAYAAFSSLERSSSGSASEWPLHRSRTKGHAWAACSSTPVIHHPQHWGMLKPTIYPPVLWLKHAAAAAGAQRPTAVGYMGGYSEGTAAGAWPQAETPQAEPEAPGRDTKPRSHLKRYVSASMSVGPSPRRARATASTATSRTCIQVQRRARVRRWHDCQGALALLHGPVLPCSGLNLLWNRGGSTCILKWARSLRSNLHLAGKALLPLWQPGQRMHGSMPGLDKVHPDLPYLATLPSC